MKAHLSQAKKNVFPHPDTKDKGDRDKTPSMGLTGISPSLPGNVVRLQSNLDALSRQDQRELRHLLYGRSRTFSVMLQAAAK